MGPTRTIRSPQPSWPSAGLLLFAVALAVAAGIASATIWQPHDREAQYALLAPASDDDIETIYGAMDWPTESRQRSSLRKPRNSRDAEAAAVTWALNRLGDRTGLALVRALVRHDATLGRGSSSTTFPRDDSGYGHPLAWRYRERPTPRADAALLAVARDRELHIQTRIPAFVALCRPGNTASLDALVDVVLDMDEGESVRRELIVRLPRIGGAAPPRLRELLDLPYHRLDQTTAVALAATGDMESPTLVLRMLRDGKRELGRFGWGCAEEFELALDGIQNAVRGSDSDLVDRIDRLRVMADASRSVRSDAGSAKASETIDEVADRFGAWLDAHPDSRATAWERAQVETAEGVRRRMAAHPRTLEAIAADQDIDVALAIRVLRETDDAHTAIILEDVDRVAHWLRPKLAACRTPRETLDRMQTLLVPRMQVVPGMTDKSDITSPLLLRVGNCMGWTVFFIALGDRLGLPLHAVDVPGHVFVRWDDGATRFNFDPSGGGVVLTDDEYAKNNGVTPTLAASGRYLRNLTRQELVSLALANHSAHYLHPLFDGTAGTAARHADTAGRLDPRNLNAWINLAAASARLGDAGKADLMRAASAAASLPEFTTSHSASIAANLATAHLGDEALAMLDGHPEADATHRYVRALALCSLGRFADARRISVELAATGDLDVKAFDAAVAFGLSADEGWTALDAAILRAEQADDDGSAVEPRTQLGFGSARENVILAVARHVLDDGPPSDDRARLAISITERLMANQRERPDGTRNVRVRGVEMARDDIRARAWERLGDPERAQSIRDDLNSSW